MVLNLLGVGKGEKLHIPFGCVPWCFLKKVQYPLSSYSSVPVNGFQVWEPHDE